MNKIYTTLVALGLALGANAQTVYSLDKDYNGKGYRFNENILPGNENGRNLAIHLNDDGTEYVALKQNIVGYAEAIAALIKNKANGTRDSSFATNGIATNGAVQDVAINNISFLTGNKIYCSGSGWGGFVWSGGAWSSQTYGGGVVAPYVYSYGGTKLNDSLIVQIGSNGEIVTFKDNGNANQNNYAWLEASGVVDYTVDGITFTPHFNRITSVPNSHYFTAGVTDTTAFIIKFGAGGFTKDATWANNGILRIPVTDLSDDAFLDLVALPDGKLMAIYRGQPAGTNDPSVFTYRFNANGTLDSTWATNGILTQYSVSKIAMLPAGEVAMLYSYSYSATNEVGIIYYSATGQQLGVFGFPLLGSSGYSHDFAAIAISANAAGDVAICGSVRDSTTGYDKPFTMRLNRIECSTSAVVANATSTSFTINAAGVAAPAIVYVYMEGDEGYRYMDTLDANNNASFTDLDEDAFYFVKVEDGNGCEVIIEVDLANPNVGIGNIAQTMDVQIYPNPANEFLVINCEEEIETAEIYSVVGQLVKFKQGQITRINVAPLAQGIYNLRLKTTTGKVAVTKFSRQ
ncbi:MAG TPA: T9SS type A sorting domain-containing protein [Chitinophagales bacterium]|nr:T9SS type A sorting domain-containing protein [Chitinophagales bacterium]